MTMDDLQVLILRNHNYFCLLFPDNSQASVMDRDRDIENLSGEHRDAARRVMSSALICPPCDEQRFNLILTGELTFFTPGPMAFAAQVGTELSYAICALSHCLQLSLEVAIETLGTVGPVNRCALLCFIPAFFCSFDRAVWRDGTAAGLLLWR